jgi:hypothetical protein
MSSDLLNLIQESYNINKKLEDEINDLYNKHIQSKDAISSHSVENRLESSGFGKDDKFSVENEEIYSKLIKQFHIEDAKLNELYKILYDDLLIAEEDDEFHIQLCKLENVKFYDGKSRVTFKVFNYFSNYNMHDVDLLPHDNCNYIKKLQFEITKFHPSTIFFKNCNGEIKIYSDEKNTNILYIAKSEGYNYNMSHKLILLKSDFDKYFEF